MKSTSKILFIVLSAFIIALTPILSLAVLPQLGDPTQKELSPGEEKIMGKKFFRAVKNSVP